MALPCLGGLPVPHSRPLAVTQRSEGCVSAEGPAGLVAAALEQFDKELPDLARMRHVAQHIDDYAIDHPVRRRQRKPSGTDLVGRRSLEVGSWGPDYFGWLDGRIDLSKAEVAAVGVVDAIRRVRDERADDS